MDYLAVTYLEVDNMGSAKFYFYPEPDGSQLVEIDMGEYLGEMYSDMQISAVDAVSLDGSRSRAISKMGEIVTIQRDRMLLGEDLAIKFIALQNHLDRGYSCAFTADSDKAWCAPVRSTLSAGVNTIPVYANPFANMITLGSPPIPASNDYVTIDTPPPNLIQETAKVDSVANLSGGGGGSFTIANRLNFAYGGRSFVRWYRFYPILKRPAEDVGQSIVTNEGGRLFSLSIRLVVDYALLFAYHPETQGESGVSLGDNLLREYTASGTLPAGRRGGGLDGIPKKFRGGNQDIVLPSADTAQRLGEFD